jgi:hypothetical protein
VRVIVRPDIHALEAGAAVVGEDAIIGQPDTTAPGFAFPSSSAIRTVWPARVAVGLRIDAAQVVAAIIETLRTSTTAIGVTEHAWAIREKAVIAVAALHAAAIAAVDTRQAATEHGVVSVRDALFAIGIGKAGALGVTATLAAPILVTLLQPRWTDTLAVLTDMATKAGRITIVRDTLLVLARVSIRTGRAEATTTVRVTATLS